jgi:hypothetical protein
MHWDVFAIKFCVTSVHPTTDEHPFMTICPARHFRQTLPVLQIEHFYIPSKQGMHLLFNKK